MAKINTNIKGYNLKETGDKVEEILQSANSFSTQLNEEISKRQELEERIESVNNNISKLERAYKAGGSVATMGDLPELSSANLGYLYNVETKFTTTSDFLEGAGIKCNAGTEVGIVDVGTNDTPIYKYNIIGGFVDLSNYYTKNEVDDELYDVRIDIHAVDIDMGDIKSDLETVREDLNNLSDNVDDIEDGHMEITPNLGEGTKYRGDNITDGLDFLADVEEDKNSHYYSIPMIDAAEADIGLVEFYNGEYVDFHGNEIRINSKTHSGYNTLSAIAADIKFKGENLFYPLDSNHYTNNTLFTDEEGVQYLQSTEYNNIYVSQIPFTRTPTGSIRVDIEFATRVTNTDDVPDDTEGYNSITLSDGGFLYVRDKKNTSNFTNLKDGYVHTVEKRNIVVDGKEMEYEYHKLSIHHILPFNNAAQWASIGMSADKPSGLPVQQIDWRVYKLECHDIDSPALILDVTSAYSSLQKQVEAEATARLEQIETVQQSLSDVRQLLVGMVYAVDTGITIDDDVEKENIEDN